MLRTQCEVKWSPPSKHQPQSTVTAQSCSVCDRQARQHHLHTHTTHITHHTTHTYTPHTHTHTTHTHTHHTTHTHTPHTHIHTTHTPHTHTQHTHTHTLSRHVPVVYAAARLGVHVALRHRIRKESGSKRSRGREGRPRNHGSIPGRDQRFCSLLQSVRTVSAAT